MEINALYYHVERASNSRGTLFTSVKEKVVRHKDQRKPEADNGSRAVEGLGHRFSTLHAQ